MIKEAIMALKDRKGSSGQAIKKVAIVRRIRSHCRDLLFRPSRSPRWRKPPDSTNPSPQYIESAHPEIKFAQHSMRGALKNGVEKGKLVQIKSSYKLSPEEKKPPPKKKVVWWWWSTIIQPTNQLTAYFV